MRKYQTILNNMITLREKEELIKTESFGSLKHDADNFAMYSNFRYIAKIRYHSEFSLCSENSAYSKNFAMPAKLPFFYCLLPASSSLLFLHPRLDEINENSYELGINQHNFNAKLYIMVKVYETCKTTKNNLETKSVVLIGPTHVNRLK